MQAQEKEVFFVSGQTNKCMQSNLGETLHMPLCLYAYLTRVNVLVLASYMCEPALRITDHWLLYSQNCSTEP